MQQRRVKLELVWSPVWTDGQTDWPTATTSPTSFFMSVLMGCCCTFLSLLQQLLLRPSRPDLFFPSWNFRCNHYIYGRCYGFCSCLPSGDVNRSQCRVYFVCQKLTRRSLPCKKQLLLCPLSNKIIRFLCSKNSGRVVLLILFLWKSGQSPQLRQPAGHQHTRTHLWKD